MFTEANIAASCLRSELADTVATSPAVTTGFSVDITTT